MHTDLPPRPNKGMYVYPLTYTHMHSNTKTCRLSNCLRLTVKGELNCVSVHLCKAFQHFTSATAALLAVKLRVSSAFCLHCPTEMSCQVMV